MLRSATVNIERVKQKMITIHTNNGKGLREFQMGSRALKYKFAISPSIKQGLILTLLWFESDEFHFHRPVDWREIKIFCILCTDGKVSH